MPEARLDGCLQWAHFTSGQTCCNCSVNVSRECFYSRLTLIEPGSRMQSIVDSCGCHPSKQSDTPDWGVISNPHIPYCANCLLYVDLIHGLPRFGGCHSCLVVVCGLSHFICAFPGNKKITRELTVKILGEQ